MKLVVISSAPLVNNNNEYYAYAPYLKELEIWSKYCDEISFACPIWNLDNSLLISKVPFSITTIYELKKFDVKNYFNVLMAIPLSIYNLYVIYKSISNADHIHLRCPGNIGLLGCIIQIFFPGKLKTAKYAGNWDLKSKQPLSYRLQKWILRNTFLTKNIKVLVYGEWENSTKNIKSFFTASYYEKDKIEVTPRNLKGMISFLFVGTLSNGKQPLYAIQLIEQLCKNGNKVQLSIFGEGHERSSLEKYIYENKIQDIVFFKGNQDQENIKKAYLENHFVILPSLSEGWPKVVAEGMFWGCLPITTKVSCLANMLDNGNRGILLKMKMEEDVKQIETILENQEDYNNKVLKGILWSRQYTLNVFENEIKMLLNS